MSTKRRSLVHSLSMFQPSLTTPDQTQPHKTTSNNRQSCRRSQSVRRFQFQTRSQSVGVSGAPHGHRLSFSRHASKEGSLGSMLERKTSAASITNHLSSFVERSSLVRFKTSQPITKINSNIQNRQIQVLFNFFCFRNLKCFHIFKLFAVCKNPST